MNEGEVTRLIDRATLGVPFAKDKKTFITVVPGVLAGIVLKQAKREMVAVGELVSKSNPDWTK